MGKEPKGESYAVETPPLSQRPWTTIDRKLLIAATTRRGIEPSYVSFLPLSSPLATPFRRGINTPWDLGSLLLAVGYRRLDLNDFLASREACLFQNYQRPDCLENETKERDWCKATTICISCCRFYGRKLRHIQFPLTAQVWRGYSTK